MNYYERHLGDYARDTAHLSALEVGVYDLLLDRYYGTEQPIPESMVYRVARATTKAEKAAVGVVLAEFFFNEGGFYRQRRADEEILRYQQSEPEREAKKANAVERQRRAREHRKALFDQLREHGIVPPYETTTAELNAALSRAKSQPVTRDGGVTVKPVTRDDTATRHQTPDTNSKKAVPDGTGAAAPPPLTLSQPGEPPDEKPPPDPIFGTGLDLLVGKGVPAKGARSFLGLLRRDVGDLVTGELLAEVERQDITDPIPWLRKAAESRKQSPTKRGGMVRASGDRDYGIGPNGEF